MGCTIIVRPILLYVALAARTAIDSACGERRLRFGYVCRYVPAPSIDVQARGQLAFVSPAHRAYASDSLMPS